MRKLISVLIAALMVFCSFSNRAYSQAANQKEKSDTIKLQTTEVFVDAIVFDRKSRLVTDLTPQDFEIYEDGVAQEISSFRIFRGSPATPSTASNAQPAAAEPQSVASREMPNLTIVLLDYSTTQFEHQKLIQDASIKYVEQKLQPNDFMAVFILGSGLRLLTDFTNDKTKLIEALKTADVTGSALATDRATLNANIAAGQSELSQLPDNDAPTIPSGPAAATAAAALMTRLSNLATAIIAQHVGSLDLALRSALDQRQSINVLTAIRSIALGVKGIEGRKTLLLFSEGFVVGPALEDQLHSVVSLANRSQLAIYAIESQGLETKEIKGDLVPRDELTSAVTNPSENKNPRGGETVFDRVRHVGGDVRESPLRFMANASGGFLIRNTNDLSTGLARVDQEMHSYYLLSYRPKNEKLDGRFRQIRVNVKRPGLSIRARNGYYAIPAGYEFLTPAEYEAVDLAHSGTRAATFPLFFRVASFQQAANQYTIPAILEIPSNALRFDSVEGKFTARLLILGMVRDNAGNLLKRFGGPVQVSVTEDEYKILKPGTVSFMNYIQLPVGGPYSFEVIVKDLLSGAVSSGERAMHLHQPDPLLSLSTILLAREVDKAVNTSAQFLSVQGAKILPSARCQFRNGDNLIFYFDIYRPQVEPQTKKTNLSIGLSLMREGQLVNVRLPSYQVSESPAEQNPRITFTRFLHLAGLPPGNYTLVVSVKDALGNQSARGQATFSLVN
ncbi:MAG TPA: VWA domain-containing protein [Blastocatellia bacterium]|nr:VWA domain-containing protein [Blastocatellia bacterium]